MSSQLLADKVQIGNSQFIFEDTSSQSTPVKGNFSIGLMKGEFTGSDLIIYLNNTESYTKSRLVYKSNSSDRGDNGLYLASASGGNTRYTLDSWNLLSGQSSDFTEQTLGFYFPSNTSDKKSFMIGIMAGFTVSLTVNSSGEYRGVVEVTHFRLPSNEWILIMDKIGRITAKGTYYTNTTRTLSDITGSLTKINVTPFYAG